MHESYRSRRRLHTLVVAWALAIASAAQAQPVAQPAAPQPEAAQPAAAQPAAAQPAAQPEAMQPDATQPDAPPAVQPAVTLEVPPEVRPASLPVVPPAVPPVVQPAETTFRWGGYIKLDVIYSSSSRGRPSDVADYLVVPGAIVVPTPDHDANFNYTARESRFWLKTSTPSRYGPIDTQFEIDFFGFESSLGSEVTTTSSSLRLRHAFGTFRGVLTGQTWSTWMDLDALPELNEFGSPAGRVFAGQGQVRYTHPIKRIGGALQIAIENPECTLIAPDGAQIIPTDDVLPDTVAKLVARGSWGHIAAAGMVRFLRSDGALVATAPTATSTAVGVGGRVSGKIMLGGKNNVTFDGTVGSGVGRYIGLNAIRDGEIDEDGDIRPINIVAWLATAQMWLTDSVRINLVGSMAQALNNSEALGAFVNKRLISGNANVMWDVVAPVRVGLEYTFARREREDGESGDLHRVQAAIRYLF